VNPNHPVKRESRSCGSTDYGHFSHVEGVFAQKSGKNLKTGENVLISPKEKGAH